MLELGARVCSLLLRRLPRVGGVSIGAALVGAEVASTANPSSPSNPRLIVSFPDQIITTID